MTVAEARARPAHSGVAFAAYHPWDRNIVLCLVGLIWLGVLMGFVPIIIKQLSAGQGYPLIIHFHAAFFVGWLLLLTTQTALIRVHRAAVHRKVGFIAMAMVPIMVALGLAAAVPVERSYLGTPRSRPAFLAIEFTDMVAFAGLATAGLLLRRDGAAHKRLILLATFYIADAGYSRWLSGSVRSILGQDFLGRFAGTFLGPDLLLLALGAYDLVTRKRLHPAYVAGSIFMLACQIVGVALYRSPAWKSIALAIIGI